MILHNLLEIGLLMQDFRGDLALDFFQPEI